MGNILNLFDKLIVEHGSAAVRGDHIALLREQLQVVERQLELAENENVELKEKVVRLEQQNTEYAEQLAAYASSEELVEHKGALFKRSKSGGYIDVVYCPSCHKSTFAHDGSDPFYCIKCKWASDFTKNQLPYVMQSLPPSDNL